MTQPAGIIDRYGVAKSVREDLSDTIYNIAMTETPFLSNLGREGCDNTFFEWQVDTLAAAVSNNAQIEGDDAANDTRAPTNRVGNYTQISRKVIQVSGTVEAVSKAGYKSQMSYELAKAGKEIKRDMESSLVANQPAVVGNSSTARRTAGLLAWIRTNSNKGATGTDPTLSGSTDGYPNAGRGAGTLRAISESQLKGLAQTVWATGGSLDMLMVDGLQKQAVSAFTGIAVNRFQVTSPKPVAIIGAADIYLSDFGQISIVPNAFFPHSAAVLLDTSYWSLATLRGFFTKDLAETGDSNRKALYIEYGLKSKNEKSSGIIADLS